MERSKDWFYEAEGDLIMLDMISRVVTTIGPVFPPSRQRIDYARRIIQFCSDLLSQL